MMEIQFSQSVTCSPDALSQEVGGETVILDLRSEQYFSLDEVGTRIWQLLEENKTLKEVFDTLINEYDVEPDQLKLDMDRLVMELLEVGLLRPPSENLDA